MLRELATGAWRLDQWLKDKVGRPYTILLSAALIGGVIANVRSVEAEIGHTTNLVVIALTIAFDLILLVNQVAQLHEYREAGRQRRTARKDRDEPR